VEGGIAKRAGRAVRGGGEIVGLMASLSAGKLTKRAARAARV
jgi:hypothetical protein